MLLLSYFIIESYKAYFVFLGILRKLYARKEMFKYVIITCLVIVGLSANKNWIKLDSHDTSDTVTSKEDRTLKLIRPKSSIQTIKDSKQVDKSVPRNTSDQELLEIFKQINNVANKVQSKIKKQKPSIN